MAWCVAVAVASLAHCAADVRGPWRCRPSCAVLAQDGWCEHWCDRGAVAGGCLLDEEVLVGLPCVPLVGVGAAVLAVPSWFGLSSAYEPQDGGLWPVLWQVLLCVLLVVGGLLAVMTPLTLLIPNARLAPRSTRTGGRVKVLVPLVLLLSCAVVAQWLWQQFSWWQDNHLLPTAEAQRLEMPLRYIATNLIVFPLEFLLEMTAFVWWLGVAAVLLLLARLSKTHPRRCPERTEYRLIAALFAASTVEASGWYAGYGAPVAFVLAYVLAAVVIPSLPSGWNLLQRYSISRLQDGSKLVARDLPTLPGVRDDLLALQVRQDALRSQARLFDDQLEAGQLTLDEHKTRQRELVELLEQARLVPASDPQGRVALPATTRPTELVIAFGPADTWWKNGVYAARVGLVLGVLPTAYFTYRSTLPGMWGALDSYFGALHVMRAAVEGYAFWGIASFTLGALWTMLPGTRGPVRGLALAAVYGISVGLHGVVNRLLEQTPADRAILRALILTVVLVIVGVAMERRAVGVADDQGLRGQRSLVRLYGLRQLGPTLATVVPLAAAAVGIYFQIKTGGAGGDAPTAPDTLTRRTGATGN